VGMGIRALGGVLAVAAAVSGTAGAGRAIQPGHGAGVTTAARVLLAQPARGPANSGSPVRSTGTRRSALSAEDAATLPSVAVWRGRSARHTVLSGTTRRFSRLVGKPRQVAVACWSERDWASVNGDEADSVYSTLGFWQSSQPHWIHLAPTTCRALQTLLTSRPRYANASLASAVNTLTHELIHALGVKSEARTECFSMQSTTMMARQLGVPGAYADRLGRLTLRNYSLLEPGYVDRSRCREGGAWDLDPDQPSPPWHANTS